MQSIRLSQKEHDTLKNAFSKLKLNPYSDYVNFKSSIQKLGEEEIPLSFVNSCEQLKAERIKGNTVFFLQNCPIDDVIPVFDSKEPLPSKYKLKTTFIGEAFLELLSILTESPPLAYETRNNGDFFHDVYAQDKYSSTQTQKTDKELYFHNDRTAHAIRADFLMLLGMRNYIENEIITEYVDGSELLKFLTPEQQTCLRKPYFITPFDDYSKDSNSNQITSEQHPILEYQQSFRYYTNRTVAAENSPPEASQAIIALHNSISQAQKYQAQINKGDLFCFPNQNGLHSRKLIKIKNPKEAKIRWLLKTYNFENNISLNRFSDRYVDNIPGLVKEEP